VRDLDAHFAKDLRLVLESEVRLRLPIEQLVPAGGIAQSWSRRADVDSSSRIPFAVSRSMRDASVSMRTLNRLMLSASRICPSLCSGGRLQRLIRFVRCGTDLLLLLVELSPGCLLRGSESRSDDGKLGRLLLLAFQLRHEVCHSV
jgi:hypothetical protein